MATDDSTPVPQPVPVDLQELAEVLEADPLTSGGILDLETGQLWPQFLLDSMTSSERGELDDRIEKPLDLDSLGSRAAYQDMCDFIDSLSDERLVDKLLVAIAGRGAFRRFKDVLAGQSGDLLQPYFSFADARKVERAAAWLAERGYTAVSTAEPGSS